MLAFKNDVSHWRKKNELTGVSVRYVVRYSLGYNMRETDEILIEQ